MNAIMTLGKTKMAEEEQMKSKGLMDKVDKVAMAMIAVVFTFLFSQIWSMNKNVSEFEVRLARLDGQVSTILGNMNQLIDKGSQTAQRTEVLVATLNERMQKFENFMNVGRRFTAEDGDRLQRQMEIMQQKLEQRLDTR